MKQGTQLDTSGSRDLSTVQENTLRLMRANPVPWCLDKRTAAVLVQRGLIAKSVVFCKEHNDSMFVLTQEKDQRE
jgi:hypothetical protein